MRRLNPEMLEKLKPLKPVVTQIDAALSEGKIEEAIGHAVQAAQVIKSAHLTDGLVGAYVNQIKITGSQKTAILLEGANQLKSSAHADKDPADYLQRKLERYEQSRQGQRRKLVGHNALCPDPGQKTPKAPNEMWTGKIEEAGDDLGHDRF